MDTEKSRPTKNLVSNAVLGFYVYSFHLGCRPFSQVLALNDWSTVRVLGHCHKGRKTLGGETRISSEDREGVVEKLGSYLAPLIWSSCTLCLAVILNL